MSLEIENGVTKETRSYAPGEPVSINQLTRYLETTVPTLMGAIDALEIPVETTEDLRGKAGKVREVSVDYFPKIIAYLSQRVRYNSPGHYNEWALDAEIDLENGRLVVNRGGDWNYKLTHTQASQSVSTK